MTIQVPFSPETEARLRAQAEAAGKDLGTYILDVLEQKLAEAPRSGHSTRPDFDPIRALQGLGAEVWEGIDPVEYQRKEREGWD